MTVQNYKGVKAKWGIEEVLLVAYLKHESYILCSFVNWANLPFYIKNNHPFY